MDGSEDDWLREDTGASSAIIMTSNSWDAETAAPTPTSSDPATTPDDLWNKVPTIGIDGEDFRESFLLKDRGFLLVGKKVGDEVEGNWKEGHQTNPDGDGYWNPFPPHASKVTPHKPCDIHLWEKNREQKKNELWLSEINKLINHKFNCDD